MTKAKTNKVLRALDVVWAVVMLLGLAWLTATCATLAIATVPCAEAEVNLAAHNTLTWDAVAAVPAVDGYRVYWQHADAPVFSLLVDLECQVYDVGGGESQRICPGPTWAAGYVPAPDEVEFAGVPPFRYLDDLTTPVQRRFYVTAYNAGGESGPSNVVEACTGTVYVPPPPPVTEITFVLATSSGNETNVSTVTWDHTVIGDGVLVVGVVSRDAVDPDRPAVAVSYNGSALAMIRQDDEPVNNVYSSLWYLVNPTPGQHAITVTYAGAVTEAWGIAATLTGVDEMSPIITHAGYTQSGGLTATGNVDVSVAGAWVVDVQYAGAAGTPVLTTGQILRVDQPMAQGRTDDRAVVTTKGPHAATGVSSMGYAYSESSQVALSMAVLRPAAVAP